MSFQGLRQARARALGFLADSITVITFIAGAGALALSTLSEWPDWLQIALFAASMLLVGASIGLLVSWLVNRERAPLGYRWVSVDQTYQLAEENPRVQRLVATITIEAVRDNVFLFVDRTHWTGKRPPRLSLLGTDHSLLVSPMAFEGWRTYVAAFKRPLLKGQQTQIVLQVEFLDDSDDPEHWTSKTPLEPIRDSLTLRINHGKISPDLDKYESVIMRPGVGQNAVVGRLSPQLDVASGVASVTIKKPRVGLRYQLKSELPYTSAAGDLDWDSARPPWRSDDAADAR